MVESMPAESGRSTRRRFLARALGAWGIVTAAPILGMILEYITPRKLAVAERQSLTIDSVRDIVAKGSEVLRFGSEPVIVIHTREGQFKAFSARCTHLGCIVHFQSQGWQHFYCNCHGSEYDVNGVNIAGPAPKPLPPYRVQLQDTSLVISKA